MGPWNIKWEIKNKITKEIKQTNIPNDSACTPVYTYG